MPYKFLEKFSKNEHTEEEHRLFVEWLKTAPVDKVDAVLEKYKQFFEGLPVDDTISHPDLIKGIELKLDSLDPVESPEPKPRRLWPVFKKIASVAAVLFFCGYIGLHYYNKSGTNQGSKNARKIAKIVPGGNKAVLTLADGSTIMLDDVKNGVLAKQGSIAIHKVKGQIIYDSSKIQSGGSATQIAYNTIATPKGGQYQVILPDGSKVWLNAASSLKFPTAFIGNERDVELTGEAYFEVAKNKLKPFKVSVNKMQVEVLGTHFNIMAYTDENSTNTTLLEGSVRIISGNNNKVIIPGEQARVNKGIEIAKVNTAEAIEWKNGNFNFSHESIQSIMRKISRWYDVDIVYQGKATKEGFVGTVPRSEEITEVLRPLELTGVVHFKIIGRRLVVMP